MEKKLSRVIVRVAPITCALLLTLLALFYAEFYGSKVVPFDQRVQQVSSWQLSSMEDAESSEVQEFKLLSIRSRGVDETLPQEPDPGQVRHNGSKFTEIIEVQVPRSHSLGSREVDETNQPENESRQVSQSSSVFKETIEMQDSRPHSLGSRMVDETLQEQESRKVHQSSRESSETVRIHEENSSQLNKSSRELNETVEMRRPEHLSFGIGRVNGTLELQDSGQFTREVHEAIGGQESRQPSPIYREANDMIREHDSRESLFTRLVKRGRSNQA